MTKRATSTNVARMKSTLLQRSRALGNTKRGLKEVCSDLLCQYDRKEAGKIAAGCFLSRATVLRVMDCDEAYRPQADTLERILRYFNAQIMFAEVKIKAEFQNHEKEPR